MYLHVIQLYIYIIPAGDRDNTKINITFDFRWIAYWIDITYN